MAPIHWQRRYDDLRGDLGDVAAAPEDVPDDRLVRRLQCLLETRVHSELPGSQDDVRAAYLGLREELRRVIFEATGKAVDVGTSDEEMVAVLLERTGHPMTFLDAFPDAVSGVSGPDDGFRRRVIERVIPLDDRM